MEFQARRTGYLNGSRASADNLDTVSDVSQTADVSESDTICSLPPRATSSHGSLGGWSTKRRKHVSFVTPTSQDVRSFEPIYEQDLSSTSSVSQLSIRKNRFGILDVECWCICRIIKNKKKKRNDTRVLCYVTHIQPMGDKKVTLAMVFINRDFQEVNEKSHSAPVLPGLHIFILFCFGCCRRRVIIM